MRDGIHLQTMILTPANQSGPLPILLKRTPYGVPAAAPTSIGAALKELMADGYILVQQNLRGRFKSEGVFKLCSQVNLADPKDTNETTDAYDTIDWLVKNRAREQRPRGHLRGLLRRAHGGTHATASAPGAESRLRAGIARGPVDERRHAPLRSAAAELRRSNTPMMEQADKNENTHFTFDIYDTYEWYLKLGPVSNINTRVAHNSLPFWNDTVEHPDYDSFWKREAWVNQLHYSPVPNLNVAGFWDQEDPWGPWQIFRHAAQSDPQGNNFMVAGPWYHGEWQTAKADSIGQVTFGGHETAREFRENIEAPFFRYYLHGKGEKLPWKASTFQSGSNTWRQYDAWPPKPAKPRNLYLHADGTLSFDAPRASGADFAQYLSDPANPVPYRQRPISPTYPGGDWRTWEVADQRFVDHRPDVTQLRERAPGQRSHRDRTTRRGAVCIHFGNRQRFRSEADRRVSRRCSGECLEAGRGASAGTIRQIAERVRTAHRHGSAARPLQPKL